MAGWEEATWYFPYVNKWYRVKGERHYSKAKLDETLFKAMANRGCTSPDLVVDHWTKEREPKRPGLTTIPSFSRLAHEYLKALPLMRRPYVLPGETGILWIHQKDGNRGVWFPYVDGDTPKGVSRRYLLSDTLEFTGGEVSSGYSYEVEGEQLLEAFGVRTPPLKDPRLGGTWSPASYAR